VRTLQADGYIIQRDDLAQLSPYQTRRLKRFGDYTLSLSPPEPFDSELLVPFALDEQAETVVA
jgi:hypothetical protein